MLLNTNSRIFLPLVASVINWRMQYQFISCCKHKAWFCSSLVPPQHLPSGHFTWGKLKSPMISISGVGSIKPSRIYCGENAPKTCVSPAKARVQKATNHELWARHGWQPSSLPAECRTPHLPGISRIEQSCFECIYRMPGIMVNCQLF